MSSLVFHLDASFCVTPCPHQKCFLRKHLKRPRIHQLYLSLHTSFFFPLELLYHLLSLSCFFFFSGWLLSKSTLFLSKGFIYNLQVREFTEFERFSKGTFKWTSQKKKKSFVSTTGLETAVLLLCCGSCVVIDSSALLVATAPWTRRTASGPRLCGTLRPVASQRFSGSWRYACVPSPPPPPLLFPLVLHLLCPTLLFTDLCWPKLQCQMKHYDNRQSA